MSWAASLRVATTVTGKPTRIQCDPRRLDSAAATAAASKSSSVDIVLSSGFLAFAKHAGFLKAVSKSNLQIEGVMGTSAGAYAGSLFCAGYSPDEVASILCDVPPIQLLRPNWEIWKGLLCLSGVVERLQEVLPPYFEDLEREFAVGVVDSQGQHKMINRGPLPEAVAASGAIPFLFAGVNVPGQEGGPFVDGGVVDRVGLKIWREYRRSQVQPSKPKRWLKARKSKYEPNALVHVISRSSPFSGVDNVGRMGEQRVASIRSTKSGMNLFNMKGYEKQVAEAYQNASTTINKIEKELQDYQKVFV